MKLLVNAHKIEIEKEPVNEKEIDITKCEFEFADEITDEFVKDVYFTFEGHTYQVVNIQNNECDIPYEVLDHKGQVEIGVVAYKVENGNEIKRYNPSPAYFNTWVGSLKDEYENYEEITPSDKEQIEQQLLEISAEMDNLDVEASKAGHTTTITITRKDGTSYDVEVLDGDKGEKGDKGEPGAIKMQIVNVLPATGSDDTIYLVPITGETGNNYEEYIYVNGAWEKLGGIQVEVDLSDYYTKEETDALIPDLTDYVKNTDYATTNVGGVVKVNDMYGFIVNANGLPYANVYNYSNYSSKNNFAFISKGTLENVIAGKNLETANNKVTSISASSTDAQYPTAKCMYDLIGNVETLLEVLDIGTGAQGGFN